MIKGVEPITSADFNKGLVTRGDFLKGDINASPNTMDVQWRFDSVLQKRLGASSTNSVAIGSTVVIGWTIDSNGTLSTNLVSFWKLDEFSGSRADSIDSNILSSINSTNSIVGIRNQAALFVAANSNGLSAGNPSNLQTGNVNFSMSSWVYLNSTSTTIEQTIISKKDPELDSSTVLLLHCDGTPFTDSSPSAHAISTSGTVSASTNQFKFGSGSLYSNSAGYLIALSSNDFKFSKGDFTIDFWAYFNASKPQDLAGMGFNSNGWALVIDGADSLRFYANSLIQMSPVFGTTTGVWTHIAVTRFNGTLNMYKGGVSIATAAYNDAIDGTNSLYIGNDVADNVIFAGYIDEFRITKGIARWTSNFTPPTKSYGVQEYEYWLYVNTNQQATFRVSSTGTNQTATVQASSIGALNTATWYRVIGWHSNGSHIGIDVNLSVNTAAYANGVRVGAAPFLLGANSASITAQGTTYMDGRIDETGFWSKMLSSQERNDLYGGGTGNTYSQGASGFSWASFDFGASGIRWLTVASGTGLYASSNRGTTFVVIGTTRTQSYQYIDRSKNVAIFTSDSYDVPLYWAGSAGTFVATLAPNSAPNARFSINYNGFLILLNSQDSNGTLNKRRFSYADENLQLTDPWTNQFDFPSSADDEVTGTFVLYKFLYVSTRYKIFRVSFVGGNPDWSYLKIKDWGFVPRTAKLVSLKGGGQVVVGLDWDRRLRMFDGFDDLFISDNIENNNGICDFAMNKISYAGSGLQICHAELNPINQEYRLNVAIGAQSTQTTHAIVLNARTLSMYPYSNQGWQTMCVAESNNQRALMAVDRSGFCYILDSGNLDGSTAIPEVYDSPILFTKNPEVVSKGKQINFFFAPKSSGAIYYQSRVDISNQWGSQVVLSNAKGETTITGTENAIKVLRSVDIKEVYNTYQFRLTTSSGTIGTANPWEMDRMDFLQQGFGIGKGN